MTSLDPLALGRDAERLLACGVDALHLDISDGHAVPFLSFSPSVVRALRHVTDRLLDVHLLVEEPERWLEALAATGADRLTFPVESARHPWRLIAAIHRLGMRAGVALDPVTPVTVLAHLAAAVELVNLQTAPHDDGADAAITGIDTRVREVRAMLPPGVELQVDGGIDVATAARMIAAGATEVVVGRAITGAADWQAATDAIRTAIAGSH